jgi:acid phosphatase type 7
VSGHFAPPPAAVPAMVWAVGDGAIGTGRARAVAATVEAGRPDAFLYLGDVYEYGTASDFARDYDTVYGPLRTITLPTPGNHDWARRRVGYDPYWARTAGGTPPPWYAVTIGGWRVLSLNSEAPHGPRSAQVRWLRRQVAGPGTCRLAFWHRPRFSAGLHGDQADVAPLWSALRGHATLVLNGHDHDMQWMRPRAGITALIDGAGGRNLYPVDRRDRRLAWSDDRHDGALRLILRPGSARFAFVTPGGRVLRSGSVRCRPGPAAPG